jgi:pimeloyl-ACP methyl ester carboxylesterase
VPTPPRRFVVLAVGLSVARLAVRARRTRPEPLPPPPAGSTTVLAGDGTHLYAQVGGDTEADVTVVFVHGLLARSAEFDQQWVGLFEHARLVRYDHRNHGRSDVGRERVDLDVLADDLVAVLNQLVPQGRIVLVGHSLGGMVTLVCARRHPALFRDRVAGVCLLATRAGHYLTGHRYENAVRWLSRHQILRLPLGLARTVAPAAERIRPRRTALVRALVRRALFGPADADPGMVAMVQQVLEEPALSVLTTLDAAVLRHDALTALPLLRGRPVVVVAGDSDPLSWPDHARRMVDDIGPDARLVLLAGVGHALNQTRAVEVNHEIRELVAHARSRGPGSVEVAS